MCLNRTSSVQRATEDITCYKIIQIYHRADGDHYCSYFTHTKIELDKPITAKNSLYMYGTPQYLGSEVVHAYCNITCDDSDIDWYMRDTKTDANYAECDITIAKIECIIPKGTKFCKGVDDDHNLCYGASVIIPKRIIKTIEIFYEY